MNSQQQPTVSDGHLDTCICVDKHIKGAAKSCFLNLNSGRTVRSTIGHKAQPGQILSAQYISGDISLNSI